ncbi:MAG: aldose 1-epimerase family protein [Gemmataceae bacterium]|nr:aldose 1-epimerase family protein [Gemmataceae bacterium]
MSDFETELGAGEWDARGNSWSISKRTLHGGLRDGVETVEVSTGGLKFTVLPTRGMGLWRGSYRGKPLGWNAPVMGPVNPKFVNLTERGGLGWLTGFDEWLCRCGLAWNGPPGDDAGFPLTLHGRIANSPAHRVVVSKSGDVISVRGSVEEGGLFYPRLRLEAKYSIDLDSSMIIVEDRVSNPGNQPVEMQLLYHVNFGAPLLGKGSRVHAPFRELWPLTAHAATGLHDYRRYPGPTPGAIEQVYCGYAAADYQRKTLAVLHDADRGLGMAMRWDTRELPCLNIWKNPAGMDDGYVTGIEPATGFPLFKAKERAAGRVVLLDPDKTWSANWSMEFSDDSQIVDDWAAEVAEIQKSCPELIHHKPLN